MYLVIIYLIGFIVSWAWMKHIRSRDDVRGWAIILGSLLIACFSWAGIMVIIIGEVHDGAITIPKPPKWL